MLSVLIPSRKDPHLQRTIDDIRQHATGPIEIIAVLDGYEADIHGATVLRNSHQLGLRGSVNKAAAAAQGEFLLKCDAHVSFCPGFDTILLGEIEDHWIVVPRRYKLDTDTWTVMYDEGFIDYDKLIIAPDRIHGQEWRSRARQRRDIMVDENVVFQGSCWVMSRKHWDHIGPLQIAGYGNFTQEPIELALKTWLGGGRVLVNKRACYAHQHRKFGRTHHVPSAEIEAGNAYSRDYWLNDRWPERIHNFQWLRDHFQM